MRTALPHRPKTKCYKTGNKLPRLEDWDGGHPALAQHKRLRFDEIGIYFRFAIFNEHRYDLGMIAPKLVNVRALAICTGKARNMSDIAP